MLKTATRYPFQLHQVGITEQFQWRADKSSLDWSKPLTVEALGQVLFSNILDDAGSWDAVARIDCKAETWREAGAFVDALEVYLGLPAYLGAGYEIPEPHLFYRTKDALSGEGMGYWGCWYPIQRITRDRPRHCFDIAVTHRKP